MGMRAFRDILQSAYHAICCRRPDNESEREVEAKYIAKASLHLRTIQASHADVAGIVFSMDRALQLDALLGSYRDNTINSPKLRVIYRATSERHQRSYEAMFELYSDVVSEWLRQDSRDLFRSMVIQTLRGCSSSRVFFLVDDDLFIEKTDINRIAEYATSFAVPSLRMGKNLNRSYTVQRNQPKPILLTCDDLGGSSSVLLHSWCWGNGILDWGYPLSLDGNIFLRDEILSMALAVSFDSPNTFENALQIFTPTYRWRAGVCYKKSRLLNIPYNRVQSDYDNIHGDVHQDDMLEMWERGRRINRSLYYGVNNVSAHQEFPLHLTDG